MVCVVPGQKILHETIQFICMDTRLPSDRGDAIVFNDSKHI